jgi:trehalose 6-phosphate phosphatase
MMEPILSTGTLEGIARSDALLAFDFDGTLAPIVDDPAHAEMRSSTRRLLARAAQLYPCAVISGRPEADVLRLLGGVTVWYVIGNRALQPPNQLEGLAGQVSAWRAALADRLARLSGISIEDKGISLAVHYRHCTDRERACAAIMEAAALLRNVRVIRGKDVVNLLPEGAPTKGTALDRLRKQLGCAATLYVGDDRTDEDVFALDGIVSVRVGADAQSSARFHIADQLEVDDLLERLVTLRHHPARRPEAVWRPPPRPID